MPAEMDNLLQRLIGDLDKSLSEIGFLFFFFVFFVFVFIFDLFVLFLFPNKKEKEEGLLVTWRSLFLKFFFDVVIILVVLVVLVVFVLFFMIFIDDKICFSSHILFSLSSLFLSLSLPLSHSETLNRLEKFLLEKNPQLKKSHVVLGVVLVLFIFVLLGIGAEWIT